MAFDPPPGSGEIVMGSTPISFCSILTDSNNAGVFRHSDHMQNEHKQTEGFDQPTVHVEQRPARSEPYKCMNQGQVDDCPTDMATVMKTIGVLPDQQYQNLNERLRRINKTQNEANWDTEENLKAEDDDNDDDDLEEEPENDSESEETIMKKLKSATLPHL